jgi:hypothetical protein
MPRDISKHVRAHVLWQVNRSNAFEISWNPWKHTDRAVYGYRLLQRCGFCPGSARNNKSARSPRAMSHNPASDICLPTRSEGIHAPSRGYNALVLRKDPWAAVFPGKIVLRSTRVHTTTTMFDAGSYGRLSSRLRSASEAPHGRWIMAATCPDCALLSPNGQDLHRRCTPGQSWQFVAMLARWSAWPALVNFCGRDVEWMWRVKERRERASTHGRPGVDCGLWMQRLL